MMLSVEFFCISPVAVGIMTSVETQGIPEDLQGPKQVTLGKAVTSMEKQTKMYKPEQKAIT